MIQAWMDSSDAKGGGQDGHLSEIF